MVFSLEEGYDYWGFDAQDIERLKISFFYPYIEKMIEVYDALLSMDEEWEKHTDNTIKRIHVAIEKLYKEYTKKDELTEKELNTMIEQIIEEGGKQLYQEEKEGGKEGEK